VTLPLLHNENTSQVFKHLTIFPFCNLSSSILQFIEHDYERNYPTFNFTRATDPSSGAPGGNAMNPEVITNPTAPIYIIEGCAGDVEHHEPFTRPQPHYSAYRSNTYGYGRMTIYNSSHLLWEQIQTDNEYPATTGTVIDAMLIVKQ
jgi:hypothetical protein